MKCKQCNLNPVSKYCPDGININEKVYHWCDDCIAEFCADMGYLELESK